VDPPGPAGPKVPFVLERREAAADSKLRTHDVATADRTSFVQ
jgi:hypothetical protein